MANIKSQIKRNKTNEKSRVANQTLRTAMRSEIKKVEAAVAENDKELAASTLVSATSKIDRAVSKGIITKSFAARQKSRLASKVNAL